MKKHISLLLCITLVLVSVSLSACSKGETKSNAASDTDGTVKIVTTIFPLYDWLSNITKGCDNVRLSMLIDKGVDLHSYQPTAEDMITISDCDMFVYVGGESDKWAADALGNKTNADMKAVNLMEALGEQVKEEEVKEGMQSEEEEAEEEGPEYDEHIWLSVKNAAVLVDSIAKQLAQVDAQHSDLYLQNAQAYIKELNALDSEYKAAIDNATVKTLLFGDRFPFRYLTEDYGLDYYAAFVGCSAESEASFETVSFLAEKTDALGLKCVITLEGTDHKLAETIVQNTKNKNQKLITLDSMQSKTMEDVKAGVSYLSVMKNNLQAITEALQ